MKSQYARTPRNGDIELDDLGFQDVTRRLEQKDHSSMGSCDRSGRKSIFHSHATRNMCIAVLLVAFVGAGIIGYGYHHSAIEQDAVQKDSENSDGNNEQMLQLRSSAVEKPRNSPEIIGHMYVFIRQSLDSVPQASFQRLRVPVARYTRRHFRILFLLPISFNTFFVYIVLILALKGPFISLMPHVPIVADRKSKQTIMYSRRNDLYILPSLHNKLRERFSIAELILAGYASLSSTGARPNQFINMADLFLSKTLTGFGIPRFNPLQGGFTSSMRTKYGSFSIPEYREISLDLDEIMESDEEKDRDNDDDQYSSEQYEAGMQNKYYRKKPNHIKYPVTLKTMTTTVSENTLTTAPNERPGKIVNEGAYFQLSHLNHQLGQSSAKSVEYNTADGIDDYTIFKNGTVVYRATGIFFAMHAIQVGSPRGNGHGQIHLWSRRNGQDELNSNSICSVDDGGTAVLIYPAVFESRKYNTATMMFSAIKKSPCSTLGLIATDFTNEPIVPSIISSEIQISNLIDPVRYATLTSSQSQLGSSTPQPVKLNDPGDIRGVGTIAATTDGSIEFTESKLYFVIAAGQVGGNSNGFVDLWLRLNGEDVSNSNTRQSIRDASTAVLVTQSVISVKAGDKLQIMFSSSNTNLGLIASEPTGEPAVPSMIFVTFALHAHKKSLPYAQLSSSKSQWGCSIPTIVKLENDDGSQDVTTEDSIIKIRESGTYMIIAAAQVGSLNGEGKGDVHLWMQLNGEDMANSNTIQSIVDTDTAVLISQTVVVLRSGDQLQVLFSTDTTTGTLGLVATQPTNEPLIPSIIFTAFRVKL